MHHNRLIKLIKKYVKAATTINNSTIKLRYFLINFIIFQAQDMLLVAE